MTIARHDCGCPAATPAVRSLASALTARQALLVYLAALEVRQGLQAAPTPAERPLAAAGHTT